MIFSTNNRLVLELYVKEGLKPKIQGGIATPGQRDGVKGLRILMDAKVDGKEIPKGSVAYIREEVLHTHPTFSKPLISDAFPEKFLIVDSSLVEFFSNHVPQEKF